MEALQAFFFSFRNYNYWQWNEGYRRALSGGKLIFSGFHCFTCFFPIMWAFSLHSVNAAAIVDKNKSFSALDQERYCNEVFFFLMNVMEIKSPRNIKWPRCCPWTWSRHELRSSCEVAPQARRAKQHGRPAVSLNHWVTLHLTTAVQQVEHAICL